MYFIFILFLALAALILTAGLLLLLWVALSPMPAVVLLRAGKDSPPEYPADYEARSDKLNIYLNLKYPSKHLKNELDLYIPKLTEKACPLIIWVHGGAFIGGDKAGVANWASCLASEGAAVAALNYEWAPKAKWPAQLIQICECCNYIAAIAQDYNIDLSRVVIAGDSAGAHMAAQFALLHTSKDFCNAAALTGVLKPHALKAVLLYCGPYDIGMMANPDNRKLRFFMSRIGWSYLGKKNWQSSKNARLTIIKSFVTGRFPPTYITDGNSHSFERQGKELAKALEDAGVTVTGRFFGKECGTVNHEYQFALKSPNAMLCYEDTISVLKQNLLL